jgi:hypothetical protein
VTPTRCLSPTGSWTTTDPQPPAALVNALIDVVEFHADRSFRCTAVRFVPTETGTAGTRKPLQLVEKLFSQTHTP